MDRASLRALALLAAALVLSMTTWFSATAVVPQLRAEWDLGNTAAAWLTIAVQVGFVIGAIISSALTLPDVVSTRLLILGACVGAAAVNLAGCVRRRRRSRDRPSESRLGSSSPASIRRRRS